MFWMKPSKAKCTFYMHEKFVNWHMQLTMLHKIFSKGILSNFWICCSIISSDIAILKAKFSIHLLQVHQAKYTFSTDDREEFPTNAKFCLILYQKSAQVFVYPTLGTDTKFSFSSRCRTKYYEQTHPKVGLAGWGGETVV